VLILKSESGDRIHIAGDAAERADPVGEYVSHRRITYMRPISIWRDASASAFAKRSDSMKSGDRIHIGGDPAERADPEIRIRRQDTYCR